MPTGVYERTPEHRAATAEAMLGKEKTPEHRANIGAGVRQSWADREDAAEQKAALSECQLASWRDNRQQRREAIALGHLRGYLSEYPERFGVFFKALVELGEAQQ